MVKYGELYFDGPFDAQARDAALIIVLPTLLNISKWGIRAQTADSAVKQPSQI